MDLNEFRQFFLRKHSNNIRFWLDQNNVSMVTDCPIVSSISGLGRCILVIFCRNKQRLLMQVCEPRHFRVQDTKCLETKSYTFLIRSLVIFSLYDIGMAALAGECKQGWEAHPRLHSRHEIYFKSTDWSKGVSEGI